MGNSKFVYLYTADLFLPTSRQPRSFGNTCYRVFADAHNICIVHEICSVGIFV